MAKTWFMVFSVIFTLLLCFYFFYPKVENFFVFYPDKTFAAVPSDWGVEYENLAFEAGDGTKLHGWYFPGNGKGPIILFSHGNAGNISHRIDNIKRLLDCGLQVFIYDYRGYGKSAGKPSEAGIYKDGLAAWDVLVKEKRVLPDNIVLFGRSLGAAVAVEIATKRKAGALIVESAFTSTREMAKGMFPFQLFAPFLPAHYNNLEKIKQITIPKLIIHGTSDELIPFPMGKELYDAAHDPKSFFPIKGAGHNDTYVVGGKAYFEKLCGFVRASSTPANSE